MSDLTRIAMNAALAARTKGKIPRLQARAVATLKAPVCSANERAYAQAILGSILAIEIVERREAAAKLAALKATA